MRRTLSFTRRARIDLGAIVQWLTQPNSGPAAWRRLSTVRAAIDGLLEHPCTYPVGTHQGVRELPCGGGYRVLYRVDPDTGRDATAGDIRVLRVFGPGQSRDQV